MPCAKLWGGPVRDHVRTYCHLGGGRMEDFYETAVEDAKRFADLARQAVADGFTAFKWMAVPPTLPLEGLKPIRAAEKCVAAMREAVGDAIDIMVDCHARPSPAMGLQFAKALEPYGLYFLEEPCWPESVDGLAMINRGRQHADRHRRARDEPRGVPRPVQRPRLRGLPARHHALRRLHRSPAHRGAGRGAPHRARAAQSAGAGQHRRVPGVRLLASRATSSARRSTPTCRGGTDVVQEGFTVETTGPHRAAEHASPGSASRSTRPK